MILISGALPGLIAVAFGTFSEHGLRESITEEHFRFLMTTLRYNQVNAVIISSIGLVLLNGGKFANSLALKWSGLLFIFGTVLFSFSIYFAVSLDIPNLVNITPIGGMTIMAVWLLLLMAGLLIKKSHHGTRGRSQLPERV